jgi:hypothetical protein
MTRAMRWFLLLEAASFGTAALVHFGVLSRGDEHRRAGIAESVITAVLLAGLLVGLVRPGWVRRAGLAVQGFALLATLVGITTIIIGIGPRTVGDVIYHIAIVAVLVVGLVVAERAPAEVPARGT